VLVEKLYGAGKEFDSVIMGIDDIDRFGRCREFSEA